MNKSSNFGLTLIELLIALAVLLLPLAGGAMVSPTIRQVWKKKVRPPATSTPTLPTPDVAFPTTNPKKITPTSDKTAEWKTHTNTFFGYSIKYPRDWQLTDRPAPQSNTWTYLTSVVLTKKSSCSQEKLARGKPWCGASFTLNVGKNPEDQTLVVWMKEHVGELPANFADITINGIRGVRFQKTVPGHPYLETEDKIGTVGLARNKMVFVLEYRVSGPDPDGSLFNQLELILSTFRFLPLAPEVEKQTPTTTQCTREYGIDTCPQGYLCYWSWECPKGAQDCGQPTGDFLCHKKCQTDSDCPSNMPFCKEVTLARGDIADNYWMCMNKESVF